MSINSNELEIISAIRKRLDSDLLVLYSLTAINKLKTANDSEKKQFKSEREKLSLYVAEFRNKELELIAGWLKNSQKSLLIGIAKLEDEIDDFNDLAETISAIAGVVSMLSSLIVGLPI
jgi:hypothetical protein